MKVKALNTAAVTIAAMMASVATPALAVTIEPPVLNSATVNGDLVISDAFYSVTLTGLDRQISGPWLFREKVPI
jgi:hypothetical protein